MKHEKQKAAPVFSDRSGFLLLYHKYGDSKGIQSLWREFEGRALITDPSETPLIMKDVSAARMLFRMGKAALLKKGNFPQAPIFPKYKAGVFRRLRTATRALPLDPAIF